MMIDDPEFDTPVPQEGGWCRPPGAVDLVLEAATMESVFAAQRLIRVDWLRREMLRDAASRGAGAGAGAGEIVERSIRLELAAAMRVTEYAAGRMIVHADALVHRYPDALDSLAGGRITQKHAEILVDHLDQLMPELRADVMPRAVTLAEAEPVGTFRRALRALIETVQASTLEQRHRAAVKDRRVVLERCEDGMGWLHTYAPIVELQAIFGRITAIGKTIVGRGAVAGDGSVSGDVSDGDARTLDQVRADVLCDLLIDGVIEAMSPEARGIQASVVVTAPVLALLDDEAAATADPPMVEGVGPIPLSRARELCGGEQSWMRVLTHPETGMVLSVGRDQYRPPPSLRKLTKWRADRCMAPGCGMPAARCEIDHQVDWQLGGSTSLENNAPICKGHHTVKHHGGWRVRQIAGSGGAIEWISPMGRRYVVQPERRVPVFRESPPSGDEPAPPF